MAADLGAPYSATPVAYQTPTAWTGFYAGVFAGLGGGDVTWTEPGAPAAATTTSRGGLAGVRVGADYQFDKFVVGAVADIAVTNIEGRYEFGGGGVSSKLDYLGTVRARAGVAATDNVLIYAHGGLAYGRTTPSLIGAGAPTNFVQSANRVGYTIGAGVEYAVTDKITLQTEYAYTDLGTSNIANMAVAPTELNETFKFHTVTAGVNFRF